VQVSGYWPLDGSKGISFLKRLTAGSSIVIEKNIRGAFEEYIAVANAFASGLGKVEIEPENFAVLAESEDSEEAAMRSYGIWKDAGSYWMRKPAYDASNMAFIACAVLYDACGGKVAGEIYSDCEQAIHASAKKLSREQTDALRSLGGQAVSALIEIGELTQDMKREDVELMNGELHKFAGRFKGAISLG
jgi:hypothetical protein